MKIEDRRKHKRYKILVDTRVITPETTMSGIADEISGDGIRILSKKAIESGIDVIVSIKIKDEILLHGTVIWAIEFRDDTMHGYKIGIQTYAIVYKDIKAIGFPKKSELLQEILTFLKEQGETVTEVSSDSF